MTTPAKPAGLQANTPPSRARFAALRRLPKQAAIVWLDDDVPRIGAFEHFVNPAFGS